MGNTIVVCTEKGEKIVKTSFGICAVYVYLNTHTHKPDSSTVYLSMEMLVFSFVLVTVFL